MKKTILKAFEEMKEQNEVTKRIFLSFPEIYEENPKKAWKEMRETEKAYTDMLSGLFILRVITEKDYDYGWDLYNNYEQPSLY